MIRRWAAQDFLAVAQGLLALYPDTPWARVGQEYAFEQDDILKWLVLLYADDQHMVFVSEEDAVLTAMVGVCLMAHKFPPYLRLLEEWCLIGKDVKALAAVWDEAKAWGKARGAVMAKRSTLQGMHETIRWERLS